MLFLVHSDINAQTIQRSLGLPEYSYYFVLKTYVEVLRELGRVVLLDDPLVQADALYDAARRDGEDCVFIAFAPPHRAPVGLRCPTLCVFAWEFSNLPDRAWGGEPRHDWRFVLRQHGRTITLSSHTAEVVRQVMGQDYPVRAIPVPVHDAVATTGAVLATRPPALAARTLHTACTVIDTLCGDAAADDYIGGTTPEYLRLPLAAETAAPLELRFDRFSVDAGLLGGFYEPESWGIWSRTATPWLLLPVRCNGRYRLSLELTAYGPNVGRIAQIEIGGHVQPLPLTDQLVWREFDFDLTPADVLVRFSGLDNRGVAGAADLRGMGIGLRALRLERLAPAGEAVPAEVPPLPLKLDGVVYTSVFNPGDGRKNWGDMLSAFCHAFRDEPRATLLLKMTHHAPGAFVGRFHYLMQTIGPVRCRVILLHGFLDDTAYRQLAEASTYALNTSHCEGLCLPLMEYMSLGIPAVAPRHTAMLDYVNAENSFIVRSSLEPHIWPHDPEDRLTTLRHRIDWSSLVETYRASFRVACEEPARYQQMGQAARAAQRAFCSQDAVRAGLAEFFGLAAGGAA